jgi:hypothetical protein
VATHAIRARYAPRTPLVNAELLRQSGLRADLRLILGMAIEELTIERSFADLLALAAGRVAAR